MGESNARPPEARPCARVLTLLGCAVAVVACNRGGDLGATATPEVVPAGIGIELAFSTYWGSGPANLRAVAAADDGSVYLAGGTSDRNWPTTLGPAHAGDSDVAVAKFDPSGRLVWSRLLGGPSEDYAYVAAVGETGELTVGGRAGRDFPTTPGAFDRGFHGGKGSGPHPPSDGFVVRFAPNGEVLWATYVGGEADENVRAMHLLPDGRVIVGGGNTASRDLPTGRGRLPGPVLKPNAGGAQDSWVAVLAPDGGSVDFLTYFGPDDDDGGDETIRALALDPKGNIWIGGTTSGADIETTPDAFQRHRGSPRGTAEAYIAKLSPDGRRLVYFSWLGGNRNEEIETEGVSDDRGAFYVAGSSSSTDFPTTEGAFQRDLRGQGPGPFDGDGFVARIEPDGRLGMSTRYGGSTVGPEALFGPAVDPAGNVWATGRMRSSDCAVTSNALQPRKAGRSGVQDAVLVAFSPDGRRLLYGSYVGGSDVDHGRHVAVRKDGSAVFIVGETRSGDYPVVRAARREPSGAFLTGFRIGPLPPPETP